MFFFLPYITEISFYKNHVAVALYTFKALYFAFSSHQVIYIGVVRFLQKKYLDQMWLPDPYLATLFNEKVQLC